MVCSRDGLPGIRGSSAHICRIWSQAKASPIASSLLRTRGAVRSELRFTLALLYPRSALGTRIGIFARRGGAAAVTVYDNGRSLALVLRGLSSLAMISS